MTIMFFSATLLSNVLNEMYDNQFNQSLILYNHFDVFTSCQYIYIIMLYVFNHVVFIMLFLYETERFCYNIMCVPLSNLYIIIKTP